MRYGYATAVVLAAMLSAAFAGSARAQGADRVDVDPVRAAELEERAQALETQPTRWDEIPSLLREAARLRADDDPLALANLETAGVLYAGSGKYLQAEETYLELFSRATTAGRPVRAAHALIDLTFVCSKLDDPESAQTYYELAQWIADSSSLSTDERIELRVRLKAASELVARVQAQNPAI